MMLVKRIFKRQDSELEDIIKDIEQRFNNQFETHQRKEIKTLQEELVIELNKIITLKDYMLSERKKGPICMEMHTKLK